MNNERIRSPRERGSNGNGGWELQTCHWLNPHAFASPKLKQLQENKNSSRPRLKACRVRLLHVCKSDCKQQPGLYILRKACVQRAFRNIFTRLPAKKTLHVTRYTKRPTAEFTLPKPPEKVRPSCFFLPLEPSSRKGAATRRGSKLRTRSAYPACDPDRSGA